MSYEIRQGESYRKATRRIVRKELTDALEAIRETEGESLGERVHSVRKSLKRVRALLRLIRYATSNSVYQVENEAIRDAGRPLSALRDAKVLIETLDSLQAKVGEDHPASFTAARELLVERETSIHKAVLADGSALAATDTAMNDALQRLNDWAEVSSSPKKIVKGLKDVYRRGRRALTTAKNDPTAGNLHEWRKQVKHLRHGLDLLTPVRAKTFSGLAQQAVELGNSLGDDHDLAVLHTTLASSGDGVVIGPLQALIEKEREQLLVEVIDRGETLFRKPPRVFVRGLRLRLRDWRRNRPFESGES